MPKLKIEKIQIGERLRQLNPAKVDEYAAIMERHGLAVPIGIWTQNPDHVGSTELVYGLHRLEAAKKLGWKEIEVVYVPKTADDIDRKIAEITENLHRCELTELERAKHIDEWDKLLRKREEMKAAVKAAAEELKPKAKRGRPPGSKNGVKSAQAGQKPKNKPGRPNGTGKAAAAKKMKVSRQTLDRSKKIASITPKAKEAAVAAGIDDNQTALLKVAEALPEQQTEKVAEIVAAQAQPSHPECWPTSTRRSPRSRAAPPTSPRPSSPAGMVMRKSPLSASS